MGAGGLTSKRGQPSHNTGLLLALPKPLTSHCWGMAWPVFPAALLRRALVPLGWSIGLCHPELREDGGLRKAEFVRSVFFL